MLCCFLNTVNGILTLLGFAGMGLAASTKQNNYIFGGLLLMNIIILAYFTWIGFKDKKKMAIVKWMFLGFSLVNINYIYKIIQNNKKFCKPCLNKNNDCCHLDCGHKKVNNCYHTHGLKKKPNKPINKINLLLNILNFLGLLINIISFFNYYKTSHNCSSSCENHDNSEKKKTKKK
jgi:hypothetical protein